MNRRLITIFLVAIVIASACCWLVYRIVSVKMSTSKPMSTTQVIAAAKDIPLGAVLTTADLTTMTLAGTPPKGAIVKQEDAIGRGVITRYPAGRADSRQPAGRSWLRRRIGANDSAGHAGVRRARG